MRDLPNLADEDVDHDLCFFVGELQFSAETDNTRKAGFSMYRLSGLHFAVPCGLQMCLDLWKKGERSQLIEEGDGRECEQSECGY